MATEGTWRPHSFVTGTKYKVIKNYTYRNSKFIAGTIVEFDCSGYERYDCTSLFRFYFKKSLFHKRIELVWNLHDNEPDSKISEYFLAIEP